MVTRCGPGRGGGGDVTVVGVSGRGHGGADVVVLYHSVYRS